MLPILLVFFVTEGLAIRTAELKGNLLYESEQQKPVIINPHYVQFNREFDLSEIKTALDLLDQYTESYAAYCQDAQRDSKRLYNMFFTEGNFLEAKEKCRESHGYLPEVRTPEESDRILDFLKLLDITETPAGLSIDYHTKDVIYTRTNELNKYHLYAPCSNCPSNSPNKSSVLFSQIKINDRPALIYTISDGRLAIAFDTKCLNKENNPACKKNKILCTKGNEYDNNFIMAMVSHACARDGQFMKQTNTYLRAEYESFLHPITKPHNTHRRKRTILTRRKRFLPLVPIIGGAIGGGVLSGAFSRVNPFHFLGRMVGGIFGLATARDLRLTHYMIRSLSNQLDKVRANQAQLYEATHALMQHAAKLQLMIQFQGHDVAVMYGELDSKVSMRYLQSVIQMTLLKIHASIVSARQGKPSPYVFGAKDLETISLDRKYSSKPLTNDIDEVAVTVAITDEDTFIFLIAVPIVEEKTFFRLFKIVKLPLFHLSNNYIIHTQHEHYGINLNTNEYLVLSQEDYHACSSQPLCSTNGPVYAITNNSPCEISSFIQNKQICPIDLINSQLSPTFLNYGNSTYYSVPHPHDIYVRCSIQGLVQSQHEVIDGIGSFSAHTGCVVQVAESAQIRPLHVAEIQNLAGNSVFGVLKQFDFSALKYPPDPIHNTTTMKPLTIFEVDNFHEGLKLLLDIQTNSTDVARAFLIIFLLILFFLIIYCASTNFRLWFNDCCSFTKPSKFWGRQYQNVPEFIRSTPNTLQTCKQKIQNCISHIKRPFKQPQTQQPTSEPPTKYIDDLEMLERMHVNNTLYPPATQTHN